MIAIFVDKEFLNDFFLLGDELVCYSEVYTILTGYSEKVLYHNFESPKEFIENPIGKKIASNAVTNVIKGSYDHFVKSKHSTKISFIAEEIKLDKSNVLNFEMSELDKQFAEIKKKSNWIVYLDDIEERKKIQEKWNNLASIKINEIQLIDKYLPKKRDQFKNFCKEYISSLYFEGLKFDVFSDHLTKNENETEREKEHIKKLSRALNSICPGRISTVNYYRIFNQLKSVIDFHDRVLISNFYIIDVGVGFDNLLNNQVTNSKLTCESILDEVTYNRIRRLNKKITKYKSELQRQVKIPAYLLTNLENC